MRRLILTTEQIEPSDYRIDSAGNWDTNGARFRLQKPISQIRSFQMSSVTWPKVWHTLNNFNRRFSFVDNLLNTVDIVLNERNYTLEELLTEIKTLMNAVEGFARWDVTLEYDYIVFHDATGSNITVIFNNEQSDLLYRTLGYREESYTPGADTLTGPLAFNLDLVAPCMYLRFAELHTNENTNLNSETNENVTFAVIPTEGQFSVHHTYQPYIPFNIQFDQSFDISVLTPLFYTIVENHREPLDFKGAPFVIIIEYETISSRIAASEKNARF